jgi:hypothetical protein
MRRCVTVVALMVAAAFGTATAEAQQEASPPSPVVRQSLDDAWWTGPMLAFSAATLPRGHFLIESYFYDATATRTNGFGSRACVLYGLVDRLTVGLIPGAGYIKVSDGLSSSGVGLGDFTSLVQYRLTQFHAGSWIPTTSVQVQETLPTGKYNRLGDRPSNGLGSGAYTTTLQLNSQTYFWLPNGRILRMRFDVSQAFSNNVNLDGVSVYGTGAGFHGHAKPGSSFLANPAWEYSLKRRWVLALDVTYRHNWSTRVTGYNILDPNSAQNPSSIQTDTGSSDGIGFAPAIEYSWNSNLGVIFGTRVIPAGHNTAASITPVVALNFVH